MLFTTTLRVSTRLGFSKGCRYRLLLGWLLGWLLPLAGAWGQSTATPAVQESLTEPATVTLPRALWGRADKYFLNYPHQSCGNLTSLSIEARLDTGPDHAFAADASGAFTTDAQVTITVSSTGGRVTPSTFRTSLSVSQTKPEHWRLIGPADLQRFLGTNSAANDLKISVSVPTLPTVTGADPGTQRIIVRCMPNYQTYAPATLTVTPATPPAATGYEQVLNWTSACPLVSSYQIQLLFRPVKVARTPATAAATSTDANYSATQAPTPGEWLQSSSLIETGSATPSYKLTLAEGEGTYHWRVRAIGTQYGGNMNANNWGPWADGAAFSVTAAPDAASNWIYSRSFSEGGRVSEKLTFANGLQQVQQTQTRLATPTQASTQLGQQVVATQTVQDFAGRDAVTSLPIPLQGANAGALGFRSRLLSRSSGEAYDAAAFDETDARSSAASTALEPLPAQEQGYYTSGNDRVADAEGYPFTRTVFSNDGTNRVVEQGGVGAALRVQRTNQHTVRTSYASVAPQELIRLFGQEAPQAEGVVKVVTTDPNNISSITYQTKDGKTIATALSGGNAPSLQNLTSIGFNSTIKEVITGSGQVISKTLTLTQNLPLKYTYKLTPAQLRNSCADYCSSCDYQVIVRIIDVSDNSFVHNQAYVIKSAEQCTTSSVSIAEEVNVPLNPGTYRIERELVPIDYYPLAADAIEVQSSTTTPRTLSDHLARVRSTLDQKMVGGVWDLIRTKLDPGTNDVDGLYTTLATYNFATETRDGQAYYKIPVAGCEAAYFPILTNYCPACNLATADFAGQLATAIAALNGQEQYRNNQHSVDELLTASGYTASQLNQLAANMGASTSIPRYKCEDVQNCWQSTLASLEGLLYLNTSLPANYTFDIVQEFLSCTGVRMRTPVTLPDPIDPTRAFEQFTYNPNDAAQQYCFTSEHVTPANFADAVEEVRDRIYACIKFRNTVPAPTTATPTAGSQAEAAAQAAMLTRQGQEICETRRDEFRRVLITQLHQQGLYIVGDTYAWTPGPAGSPAVPTITSTPLLTSTPRIPLCEIESLTQSIVDRCKGDATVSVVYGSNPQEYQIGSSEQQRKLRQAMFSTLRLTVNDAQCAPNWQPIPLEAATSSVYDITQTAKELLNAIRTVTAGVNRLTAGPGTHTLLGCSERLDVINEKSLNIFSINTKLSDWAFGREGLAVGEPIYAAIVDARTYRITFNSYTQYYDNSIYILSNLIRDSPHSALCPPIRRNISSFYSCESLVDYTDNGRHLAISFKEPYTGASIPKYQIQDISEPYINFFGQSDNHDNTSQGVAVRILRNNSTTGSATWQEASIFVDEYDSEGCSTRADITWKEPHTPASCTPESVTSLCYQWSPNPEITQEPTDFPIFNPIPEPCNVVVARQLRAAWAVEQNRWIESRITAFTNHFQQQCVVLASQQEEFSINYELGYHHFTLYYYDRAGNLIKTVPPAGVAPLTDAAVTTCLSTANRSEWPQPAHTQQTTYLYNSLHQLEKQLSPDGGETHFFYNRKGQLRFSQNARQRLLGQPTYSYTRYDALGRVTEVGETFTGATGAGVTGTQELPIPRSRAEDMNYPPLDEGRQVTRTVYGEQGALISYRGLPQRYLANRVAYSYYDVDGNPATATDNSYTYYSYDPHGNVEWLGQQQNGLGSKFVRYEYDLLSNKVTQVLYQEGQADQFYHRYSYDADNRLTQVQTSVDGRIWDQDARYTYFAHGPLKRLELGEDHVQGIDYTYTLQGWLKGLNHPGQDPGQDGSGTTRSATGKDAFSMTLGYFTGDFTTSNAAWTAGSSSVLQPQYSLYNGNIAAWTSATRNDLTSLGAASSTAGVVGEKYRYDQLNRLVKSTSFTQATAGAWPETQDYASSYRYDPNGNLTLLRRNGSARLGQLEMDALTYEYDTHNGRPNQLQNVFDPTPDQPYYDDVKFNVLSSNPYADPAYRQYSYDAIGNLVLDRTGGSGSYRTLEWNVYGKLAQVQSGPTRTRYDYDAQGNRIHKVFTTSDGESEQHVYYVRDAQGNVLAVYEQRLSARYSAANSTLSLTEQPIYGSSRLGMRKLGAGAAPTSAATAYFARSLGQKQYELTDHLGNVRALVSDIKRPETGGTYKPDLLAYYGYYPFGMLQPGRSAPANATLAGGYRYGYNGKEKDNNGEFGLTTYDYGLRIYSSGLGRFLSVDPLTSKFAFYTPYSFAGNSPLANIDLDGAEALRFTFSEIYSWGRSKKLQASTVGYIMEQTFFNAITKVPMPAGIQSFTENLYNGGEGLVNGSVPDGTFIMYARKENARPPVMAVFKNYLEIKAPQSQAGLDITKNQDQARNVMRKLSSTQTPVYYSVGLSQITGLQMTGESVSGTEIGFATYLMVVPANSDVSKFVEIARENSVNLMVSEMYFDGKDMMKFSKPKAEYLTPAARKNSLARDAFNNFPEIGPVKIDIEGGKEREKRAQAEFDKNRGR